jgi:DNA-binding transcriptional MocR family regulator
VAVPAQNVLIVNGAQHGLATTVMALLTPGDVVAADALTYPGFKVLADVHRLELIAIPAAGNGPDLDALERLCARRRIRAVYAIPTLHNPLGWVMSARRRRQLVATARRHGLLIIEDAAYAFLDEDSPVPLAALAPETTVYVSGLSKSVATGMRVGFVAAPAEAVPRLERVIRASTWNTPGLLTAIACNWIEDGTVTRLEDEKRRDAIARQAIAAEAFNGLRTLRHPASYFLWLPLAEEVRADELAMALVRERISVSTAEPFATSRPVPHAIRLALGSVELDTLRNALQKVKRLVADRTY